MESLSMSTATLVEPLNEYAQGVRDGLYEKNGDVRGLQFHVLGENDEPISLTAVMKRATRKCLVDFAGGCKFWPDGMSDQLFPGIAAALTRDDGTTYEGVVFSGATEDQGKRMVTQIPSYLARLAGWKVLPIGHAPRVDNFSVGPNRQLYLTDDLTQLDVGYVATAIRQKDGNTSGGWDYDVPMYVNLMAMLKAEGWKTVNFGINGGDTTREELLLSLHPDFAIPNIWLAGTLREVDALCKAVQSPN
jgi:hypothetical protein